MSTQAYCDMEYSENDANKFRNLSVKLLRTYPKVSSLIQSKLNYRPPYSDYMFMDYDPIYNTLANVDSLERVVYDRKQRESFMPGMGDVNPLFFTDYEYLMKAGIPMIEVAIGMLDYTIENWSFWGRNFAKFGNWISNKFDWVEIHPKTSFGIILIIGFFLEELGYGLFIDIIRKFLSFLI